MNDPTAADLKRAQLRIAVIRADISTRLWPVNSGMSSDMFSDMMDRMALLQYTFEQRTANEVHEGERRRGELDRRTRPGDPPVDDDTRAKGNST